MAKKSFKIIVPFPHEPIPIEKEELPKAFYAFINGSKFLSKSGKPWGGKIISIEPDWHVVMGWNKERELDSRDWQDIGSERVEYAEALMSAASKIAREETKKKDISLLDQSIAIEAGTYALPN